MVDRDFWRALVEEKSNNIRQACRVIGIDKSQLYDERGLKSCTTATLEKIADYLNVTTDFLLKRKSSSDLYYDMASESSDEQVKYIKMQIDILKQLLSEKEDTIRSLLLKSENIDNNENSK